MIRLMDGYAIEVDSHCYTVGVVKTTKVTDKKTGETTEKEILTDCRYYPDLHMCLMGFWKMLRRRKLSTFEGSLQDAITFVKKLDERVIKLMSKIEEEYK